VASSTVLAEASGMHVVLGVTGHARAGLGWNAVGRFGMATRTGQLRVSSVERVAGSFLVIEARKSPSVRVVTGSAILS